MKNKRKTRVCENCGSLIFENLCPNCEQAPKIIQNIERRKEIDGENN